MKFQNPSLNSVLTGRTDGRTDKPKPICSPLFQSWGHKNNDKLFRVFKLKTSLHNQSDRLMLNFRIY